MREAFASWVYALNRQLSTSGPLPEPKRTWPGHPAMMERWWWTKLDEPDSTCRGNVVRLVQAARCAVDEPIMTEAW